LAGVLDLVEPYLTRSLQKPGVERPSRKQILEEFGRVWPEFTATIGVQEPSPAPSASSGWCACPRPT